MAISIHWPTGVITVPQADLTPLGGSRYQLDVNAFRLALKELEDSEDGQVWPTTHNHNTELTLSGVTYARSLEIINGYTVEFEDGMYSVTCIGANHNIADVKTVNSVSLIIGNSAGLIVVSGSGGGSGASAADVWNYASRTLSSAGVSAIQSGLATSSSISALNNISAAQVNTEVSNALNTYDAPTKAELDSAQSAIISEVNSNETKLDIIDSQVDLIKTKVDTLENADLSGVATAASIAALNNVSTAQVNTEVANALSSYDVPTKTELDAAQTAIIAQVDANEGKLDIIDSQVDLIKAKVDTLENADLSGLATSAEIAALNDLDISDVEAAVAPIKQNTDLIPAAL